MNRAKMVIFAVLFVAVAALFSACKENNPASQEEENEPEVKEPFTLRIGVHFDEKMFKERFKDPIEEYFDHITVEQVNVFTYGRGDLEELFSSGQSPDFFFTISQDDMEYFELDFDLEELLVKHDVDLSVITDNLLDTIRARDKEGRLVAWPYEDTYYVLLYNKDIFDQLGESYPTDDMTWEETIALAKRLTREVDGVQYRGLDFADDELLSQFSVNATDPDTGEVLIQQAPEFAMYLNLYKELIDIPGLFNEGDGIFEGSRFESDRNTAMLMTNSQALTWYDNEEYESLNFDLAAVPAWESHPGIAPKGFLQTLTVNPESEHIDDVIEVFKYFVSEAYQMWMARNGIGVVSDKKEILEEFYQDFPYTHDMNVAAIFKNKTAPPVNPLSPWDKYVDVSVQQFFESEQKLDVNSFLRIAKEEAEERIREATETE